MLDFGQLQADIVKNIVKIAERQDEDSWVDLSGYGACGGSLIPPVEGEYGD